MSKEYQDNLIKFRDFVAARRDRPEGEVQLVTSGRPDGDFYYPDAELLIGNDNDDDIRVLHLRERHGRIEIVIRVHEDTLGWLKNPRESGYLRWIETGYKWLKEFQNPITEFMAELVEILDTRSKDMSFQMFANELNGYIEEWLRKHVRLEQVGAKDRKMIMERLGATGDEVYMARELLRLMKKRKNGKPFNPEPVIEEAIKQIKERGHIFDNPISDDDVRNRSIDWKIRFA